MCVIQRCMSRSWADSARRRVLGASHLLLLGVLGGVMIGCFEPRYPVGIPCSETQTCPPTQRCDVDGICRVTPLQSPDANVLPVPDAGEADAHAQPSPDCESCDANAACVDPGGSAPCQCSAGYRGDGFACADIDECMEQSHTCSVDASCANTAGAFSCTCNPGFYGDGTSCARPSSCGVLLGLDPLATTGMHTIDPDGSGPVAPLDVHCDMATDGGGWTLIGDYISNAELFDFDPTRHQAQNDSGGAVLAEPPRLDGTRTGHVAYDLVPFSTVRLQCRSNEAEEWFGAQTDLVSDWSPGDRGVYGSQHWAVVGDGNHGRSSHFICGLQVSATGVYAGVAICSGPGSGGSFGNHVVSLSFTHNASSYTGGLSIGCNGTGINRGKDGRWQARVWLR